MNNNYRFHLAKSPQKYICPQCGKRTFTPYVDSNEQAVNIEVFGRCDRECNCGYNEYPHDINQEYQYQERKPQPTPPPPPPVILPFSFVEHSERTPRTNNHLYNYLCDTFNTDMVSKAFSRYHVGTDRKSGGAIFWQIDEHGRVLDGHVMIYEPNGHRRKNGYSNNYIGAILRKANKQYKSTDTFSKCLFGLHLINEEENKDKPIYLFESEKTALIISMFNTDAVCLATCSCQNLNAERLKALKGRKVEVFADYDEIGRTKWENRDYLLQIKQATGISELYPNTTWHTYTNGVELNEGDDYADFLIKLKNRYSSSY